MSDPRQVERIVLRDYPIRPFVERCRLGSLNNEPIDGHPPHTLRLVRVAPAPDGRLVVESWEPV